LLVGHEDDIPEGEDYAFDGGSFGQSDLGGGDVVNKDGWYHMEVADVVLDLGTLSDQGKPKSPSIRFDMTVLESVDKQSPAGSRHFHRIYVGASGGGPPAAGSIKSALRFGIGLGLLETKEIDGREATVIKGTNDTKIGSKLWLSAKGRQIVARIEKGEEEKPVEGRKPFPAKHEIPFGRVYQVDDPQVSEVPKNKQALALAGKTVSTATGGVSGGVKNTTTTAPAAKKETPAPVAAAAAADDDLSDL
jgi:hypothetical protein